VPKDWWSSPAEVETNEFTAVSVVHWAFAQMLSSNSANINVIFFIVNYLGVKKVFYPKCKTIGLIFL
jgi:hypothetical protein